MPRSNRNNNNNNNNNNTTTHNSRNITSRFIRGNNNNNNNRNGSYENPNTPPTAMEFASQAEYLIKAEVRMISGCHSEQTSADVHNIAAVTNKLPSSNGKAGGACTSALLELLYDYESIKKKNDPSTNKPLSFQSLLLQLRSILSKRGFDQIPQLSSSRPLDVTDIEWNVNSNTNNNNNSNTTTGTARALLVGINYIGEYPGQLNGCHNDVLNLKQYLINVAKYRPENVLVLIDDGKHHKPTRTTIINALQQLAQQSRSGDSVYFHYSGHGGLLNPEFNDYKLGLLSDSSNNNTNNTNNINSNTTLADQYDEIIYPVDHKSSGHIRDFSLYKNFVQPMVAGVTVTCIMDCCHSGSVLQLPYAYQPTPAGTIRSFENATAITNLAFLNLLMGYPLPVGGIFDSIISSIEDTTNEPISNYIGAGNDAYDTVPSFNDDGIDDNDNNNNVEDTNDRFVPPNDNDVNNNNYGGDDDYYDGGANCDYTDIVDPPFMNRNSIFPSNDNNNNDWVGTVDNEGFGTGDDTTSNDIDCGCVADVLSALLQQDDE